MAGVEVELCVGAFGLWVAGDSDGGGISESDAFCRGAICQGECSGDVVVGFPLVVYRGEGAAVASTGLALVRDTKGTHGTYTFVVFHVSTSKKEIVSTLRPAESVTGAVNPAGALAHMVLVFVVWRTVLMTVTTVKAVNVLV